MKQITIKIPTSFSELRKLFKERTDRRFKHNKSVLIEFAKSVHNTANSGYWRNDISESMKYRAFGLNENSELNALLHKSIDKLK